MTVRPFLLVLLFVFAAFGVRAQSAPQDVNLTAPDGVILKATFYGAAKPGPGILLLHQCNRDRKSWATLAPQLAAYGFHVLALDLRGYGDSGGPVFVDLPNARRVTEQAKWPADIDVAYSYLTAQAGVDKQRIGAAGASCGVNNSIQLARRHPEVKTLVLLSGPTNRDGRAYLRQAGGMPILGSAADDDGTAAGDMEWLLSFSANPNNKFLHYTTGGHGTEMFAVQRELQPAIRAWFGKYLRNAATRPPTQASGTAPAARKTTGGISPAEFFDLLETPEGAARAVAVYEEAKKKDPAVVLFPEGEVNALGYALLPNNPRHAIDVFKVNVAAYPNSANVYDSLADGYVAAGERALAIEFSEKTLEKLRTNPPANQQATDAIRQSAEQKLQQLRGTGGGAAAPRGAPPPPFEELFRMPVVYSVSGMDQAQVRSDVTYKTVDADGGKVELKIDVYTPAGGGTRFPVVIFISGGGVENPDWRKAGVYVSYGKLAAAHGFVGITYQKRYQRGAQGLATGFEDTADLIRYVREHAVELHADPDRMATWGFSAGGMLLAYPLRERPAYIRAVVNFYGVSDALSNTPEDIRRAIRENGWSPLESLKRPGALPALFIGRAGLDGAELNASIDAFVMEAMRQNASVEVMNHPAGRHGFDILDADARSREIIARAFAFLKTQLAQ